MFLLIDGNYLAHRAHHTFKALSFENAATGVCYGVFKDILSLIEKFSTYNLLFCWDEGRSLRRKANPHYKEDREKRKEKWTEQEKIEYIELQRQINLLKNEYLPTIGFPCYYQSGYEADDIIAVLVKKIKEIPDEIIIVSADTDLYQLLAKTVSIYHPQKDTLFTREGFIEKYQIPPKKWIYVKAIAGCSSDNILGIKGIGEKSVVKYMLKQLKGTKAQLIREQAKIKIQQNLPLVKLPYKGINENIEIQQPTLSKSKWNQITKQLNMKSLLL